MGYKNAELRLGKNDTPLDDPRAGEVAMRIDSTGAIYTKPEGSAEIVIPTAATTAAEFYPKSDFSASPGAAEAPLKTTAAGALTLQNSLSIVTPGTTTNSQLILQNTDRKWTFELAGSDADMIRLVNETSSLVPLRIEGNAFTNAFRINSTGVAIGGTAAGAIFHIINNSATKIAAKIQLAAGQIANAFEVQDSTTAVLASIDATGALTLPYNATGADRLNFQDSNGATGIRAGIVSGNSFRVEMLNATSGIDFRDATTGTSIMRMLPSGLVGVGTPSPSGRFHIIPTSSATRGFVIENQPGQTINPFIQYDESRNEILALTPTGTIKLGQQSTASHEINGRLKSSTTADQAAARIAWSWNVATHASREADLTLYASDFGGEREGFRLRAGGTEPEIGFYGVTPTARQLLATGTGATVDNVISALQTLGLLKQA